MMCEAERNSQPRLGRKLVGLVISCIRVSAASTLGQTQTSSQRHDLDFEQLPPTTGICCIGANDSEPIPCSMDCWESSFRSKLENVAGVNCSFKTETSSKLITSPHTAR